MHREIIESASVVSRTGEFISTKMDDDTVMMSIEQGKYFGLDAVGSRIWDLLESPTKVHDLVTTLVAEFEVTPDTCKKDVITFLDTLHQKEMLEIH